MDLDKVKSVCIIGDIDAGKTNLAFYLLRQYKGARKIYLVGYPKKIDNFASLSNWQDMFKLTNSIIFIDELQKFIKIYDRRANYDLMELISLFKHQNNTLIFTTQLSQFITRGVEAFVDCWVLTRLMDLATLKNGSKPKRVIQSTLHPQCTKWSLNLRNGEYLEFSEMNMIGENGVKKFTDQKIQKDWKNCEEMTRKSIQTITEKRSENKTDLTNITKN